MNFLKSHFWYNKSQRNGILFLIILIIVLQILYVYGNFSSDELQNTKTPELLAFQHEIDSLKAVEIEKRKPKIFPFNPSFITDYKGYKLGMSVAEIDRLLAFRKKGKYINSVKEFQRVTKISDSLLAKISPYFKFPDWVTKRNNRKRVYSNVISSGVEKSHYNKNRSLSEVKTSRSTVTERILPVGRQGRSTVTERSRSTTDLNKATAKDLQTISGIGKYFSQKIIKYRDRLQGFTYKEQLYEVWNLDKEVADKALAVFKIVEKPVIKKINVNTASFKEVLKIPYIDYELCKKIFNFRDEVAELQSITELKNIEGFPVDKYERIILYLEAK